MTRTEMIHTAQEGNEWSAAVKQDQMTERYRRRKEQRKENQMRLEERNAALRNMLKRK